MTQGKHVEGLHQQSFVSVVGVRGGVVERGGGGDRRGEREEGERRERGEGEREGGDNPIWTSVLRSE
ncbi:hypothetical protein J6590_025229 [Homalodisca vitripennis]|nr:hypothetical protein J6590_025229 [Homalodisca vitripennis]